MKKIIIIALIVVLVVAGLVILTGCTKNDNGGNSKNGLDLKLDLQHMNSKIYNAHINLTADDKVTELDEEEPNSARIENEKDNYVIDIRLDAEAKEAYNGFQTSAKECEGYKEVSFGKYSGYYAEDDGDIFGYILLDKSDETFNVFVNFVVYAYDDSAEGFDVQATYNSSNIQNILNKVEFKTSK